MKKIVALTLTVVVNIIAIAQSTTPQLFSVKSLEATPVKSQGRTGTCWCFATTSLVESDKIRKDKKALDLSEIFTVRNIYVEKAKNYVLRQGKAQFGEGALGPDEIRAVATYGAIPLSVYSGLINGKTQYNHQYLFAKLQQYLDSTIAKQPVKDNWLAGYIQILDDSLGKAPASFTYEGKNYSPISFAKEVLQFNASDYISITSFTHAPYYSPLTIQVPDNFANNSFYNLPLEEMLQLMQDAVAKGYSISWDADVSNNGFLQKVGLALNLDDAVKYNQEELTPDTKELTYDATIRQNLYENLTTQDDHLMHITGTGKSKDGKPFFIVKNSWGNIGPLQGYIYVSKAYSAINTISIVLPKAALSKELLAKLKH
jgi:bleomycin hydrolase